MSNSLEKNVENIQNLMIDLSVYWANKFRVGTISFIITDKDIDCEAYVERRNGFSFLCFNPEQLVKLKLDKIDLLALVFHELGHLKYNALYNKTGKKAVECEFIAESFCLKQLKKFHPKYYREYVKRTISDLEKGRYEEHYLEAFLKIPQYRQAKVNDKKN